MNYTAEIICVGTELLLGDIVNTNAVHISRALASIGIDVYYQETVGDNHDRLAECIRRALDRSDIIITSGGLGPTYDDITRETVAEVMGLELVLDPITEKRLHEFFEKRHCTMTVNNMRQAMVPDGAKVLYNSCGTAPGICIEKDGKTVILLPGPPREIVPLFDEQVMPILKAKTPERVLFSRNINVYGIGESAVEDKLKEIMVSSQNPTLAPYAKDGEVLLRVTASAPDEEKARTLADGMVERVKTVIGEYIYAVDGESLQKVLVSKLKEKSLTVATAESCTGGMISSRITEVPGASAVFECGVCSYSPRVKSRLIGVDPETIEKYGVVSAETAKEMALGIKKLAGSDIAVSTTGIAGPDGCEGKPVGLVYVAVAYKDRVEVTENYFARRGNEREYIRRLASNAALYAAIKAAENL